MIAALLALAFFCSVPLIAQGADTFDPGAYVQVELILFTRTWEGQGTNRTGVRPEDLDKYAPRRFPPGLLSVRGAMLDQSQDVSWFENEWALIEPQLLGPGESELALVPLKAQVPTFVAPPREEMPEEAPPPHPEAPMVAQTPEELSLWQRYRNWYTKLISNSFSQLEKNEWKLRAALGSVMNASDMKVIMHGVWRQPIGVHPQAILLHGGEIGEVGVLRLKRQAFVQAEVLMWRPLAQGYAELHESRPMRLARVYYFDHPLMGLILRVDPIKVPAEFR